MHMYYAYAWRLHSTEEHQTLWNWDHKRLYAGMWILGTKHGPLQERQVLLTSEAQKVTLYNVNYYSSKRNGLGILVSSTVVA